MRRPMWTAVMSALLLAGMAAANVARADFEITAPDGRRILLRDNGTWQYADPKNKGQVEGEAILTLERRIERGSNCRFAMRLVNNFPYEIRSFVPYYSAYRANGVLFDTVSSGSSFAAMRPGDTLVREVEFVGITCGEIARLQVVGGDRCNMGDLDKFATAEGQCLARVRVVASDLVRFEK